MTVQEKITNVGTSAGPGFCVFNGTPFLAWKGMDTDSGLYWSKASSLSPSANGEYDWAAQTKVAGVGSSAGPAVCSFGGKLYMVWKGEGTDVGLYLAQFDGKTWTPQQTLSANSSNAPAIAATSKALYIAWKGEQGDNRIFWFCSTDGKSFITQAPVPGVGGTSDSPALAVAGDTVYLAWKAEPGDNRLFWSSYDGSKWSAQQRITSGTSTGPGLVADGAGALWLAWRAVNHDGIFYCSLTDASKNQWSPQVVRYGVGTSSRPALASTGKPSSGIMMAWKGEGTDQGIYYGSLILPVASTITFVLPRQNIGQGSASSFATQAQLVMNQDGSCNFSGTFFSENSWPEPSESWAVGFAIKDGSGHAYTFSATGETSPGDTQPWNQNSTNVGVAQNWSGIVLKNPTPTDISSFYWTASDDASFWQSLSGDLRAWFDGEDLIMVLGTVFGQGGPISEDPSGE